jgi:hypothetical protein
MGLEPVHLELERAVADPISPRAGDTFALSDARLLRNRGRLGRNGLLGRIAGQRLLSMISV